MYSDSVYTVQVERKLIFIYETYNNRMSQYKLQLLIMVTTVTFLGLLYLIQHCQIAMEFDIV